MKGNVFAVCGLLGTAILNASKDFFAENKIPLITAYGDVRIWAELPKDKLKYVFVAYPDYEDEADYLTIYTVTKLGAKKIALFYQNDDYGKMALSGVKKGLEAVKGKAELAGAVPYEVSGPRWALMRSNKGPERMPFWSIRPQNTAHSY